jgi:N-acetylneuraminate synthase/N,N'-diacetyllegionaminate synthase
VNSIRIGGREVGDDAPTYIIAEIGSNHDGSVDEAVRLIEAAANAGADCVKFQSFKAETLVAPTHPGFATLQKLSLPKAWYPKLKQAADRAVVHFTSTPFDLEALADLVKLGVPAIKIASGDLTYTDLLKASAASGIPVLLSTGAAYLGEVDDALRTLRDAGGKHIALLHCESVYPATFEGLNLRAIETLRMFGVPVGLSDHTPGSAADIAAVALGARLIEKHVTFSRDQKGPDHSYALTFEEFGWMVQGIRAVESALGTGDKVPVEPEVGERQWARRGVYAARALKPGDVVKETDLICLRPVNGVPATRRAEVVGRTVRRAVGASEPITWDVV